MGDMGDYWRDIKEASRAYKQRNNWVSSQYKTEEDRELGELWKHSANSNLDDMREKLLKKLKLSPIRKNVHSFQITLKGRKGMYYNGKEEKIIWNDKHPAKFNYWDNETWVDLEEYIKRQYETN